MKQNANAFENNCLFKKKTKSMAIVYGSLHKLQQIYSVTYSWQSLQQLHVVDLHVQHVRNEQELGAEIFLAFDQLLRFDPNHRCWRVIEVLEHVNLRISHLNFQTNQAKILQISINQFSTYSSYHLLWIYDFVLTNSIDLHYQLLQRLRRLLND